MKLQYEISLSDLLIDRGFQKLWASKDETAIRKVLYICGMDTAEPFKLEPIDPERPEHRNRQNKVVSCERYVGVERQDQAWMRSPYCSQENKIASCEGSLAAELNVMNRQGFSGKFEEMGKRYAKSHPEGS